MLRLRGSHRGCGLNVLTFSPPATHPQGGLKPIQWTTHLLNIGRTAGRGLHGSACVIEQCAVVALAGCGLKHAHPLGATTMSHRRVRGLHHDEGEYIDGCRTAGCVDETYGVPKPGKSPASHPQGAWTKQANASGK